MPKVKILDYEAGNLFRDILEGLGKEMSLISHQKGTELALRLCDCGCRNEVVWKDGTSENRGGITVIVGIALNLAVYGGNWS